MALNNIGNNVVELAYYAINPERVIRPIERTSREFAFMKTQKDN